ncbi:MAG: GHKL domain-containing protein [Intestinimonas sp.]|jgi:hypothetical protein|nr:GHKL domain-containing protein [Intestinimonas sp.]
MIGIEILRVVTGFCCAWLVLRGFFVLRTEKRLVICATVMGGLLYGSISLFAVGMPWMLRAFLVILIWYGMVWGAFSGNWRKKLLVVIGFWAMACATDYGVWAGCVVLTHQDADAMLSQQGSDLLVTLCARILLVTVSFGCYVRTKRKNQWGQRDHGVWVFLLLIPSCTIFGISMLVNYAIRSAWLTKGVIALCSGLLVLNMLLLIVLNQLEQSRIEHQEKAALQRTADNNWKQAKVYRDIYRQQRKVTHEFHNQLEVLNALLDEGNAEKAAEYVRQLRQSTLESCHLINTNHPMADAILNQKYALAKKQGITIRFQVNDLSELPMQDADLVTLLGNLLDNAIHACAQAEKQKQIWVKLWKEGAYVTLSVRNTCPKESTAREEKTEKSVFHGFGMENICLIMKKYHYDYSVEKQEGLFCYSAVLG